MCAGLAQQLAIDAVIVRLAFLAAALLGGLGVVVYLLAWVLIPTARVDAVSAARMRARRADRRIALGAGMLVLSLLLLLRALGWWLGDAIVWPLVAAAAGALLIWQQSTRPPARRMAHGPGRRGFSDALALTEQPDNDRGPQRMAAAESIASSSTAAPAEPPTRLGAPALGGRALAKIGFGVSLVVGAGLLFLWTNGALSRLGHAALTVVVVLVALALILAPLWLRLIRSLADERAQRVRSQERTAVAAHLHDSVLQTLALIQRRAQEPSAVAALARHQERELRDWLSDRRQTPSGSSVADALKDAAAQIEGAHGARIEVVVVGRDCPVDAQCQALVGATREAMLNAAKHAGASTVAVYAEFDRERIAVYVRDRGPGFDPSSVPSDRHGLRDSIIGRMKRHGGSAAVRSLPGRGTEIELSVRRRARV